MRTYGVISLFDHAGDITIVMLVHTYRIINMCSGLNLLYIIILWGHPSPNFHGTAAYNQYICYNLHCAIIIMPPGDGSDVWRAIASIPQYGAQREANHIVALIVVCNHASVALFVI